jgi:hypothetical protein
MYKLRNLSGYRLLTYRAQSIAKGNRTNLSGEKARKEFLNILSSPLLKSEKRALSYPATITYYHVRALVYESLGKNVEALQSRKQLIGVMDSKPEKLKVTISNYIITIYTI